MRTATKAAKRQQTTTKTAAEIEGRDVIAALGGRAVLQEIEREHKHPATPYAPAWVEYHKRARALMRLVEKRIETVPYLQPFDGLDIHGAAFAINYCIGAQWLNSDPEQYIVRIPLTALCDLLVEIARNVLAQPESHFINGVKWYLNKLQFDYATRGDFGDEVTTLTRVGVDRRHCHTVDRY